LTSPRAVFRPDFTERDSRDLQKSPARVAGCLVSPRERAEPCHENRTHAPVQSARAIAETNVSARLTDQVFFGTLTVLFVVVVVVVVLLLCGVVCKLVVCR
jgi:hypothetical protein